jgi:hypothetical protein
VPEYAVLGMELSVRLQKGVAIILLFHLHKYGVGVGVGNKRAVDVSSFCLLSHVLSLVCYPSTLSCNER